MEPDTPRNWPSAQIDTTITVVTPWMRSLLFQLTMADPVKVKLVNSIYNFWTTAFFILCFTVLGSLQICHSQKRSLCT